MVPYYLHQGGYVLLFVCLLAGLRKTTWQIFAKFGGTWATEETVGFHE